MPRVSREPGAPIIPISDDDPMQLDEPTQQQQTGPAVSSQAVTGHTGLLPVPGEPDEEPEEPIARPVRKRKPIGGTMKMQSDAKRTSLDRSLPKVTSQTLNPDSMELDEPFMQQQSQMAGIQSGIPLPVPGQAPESTIAPGFFPSDAMELDEPTEKKSSSGLAAPRHTAQGQSGLLPIPGEIAQSTTAPSLLPSDAMDIDQPQKSTSGSVAASQTVSEQSGLSQVPGQPTTKRARTEEGKVGRQTKRARVESQAPMAPTLGRRIVKVQPGPKPPRDPAIVDTTPATKRKEPGGTMKMQSAAKRARIEESFQLGSSSTVVSSQAKYGPTADLTEAQVKELKQHYPLDAKGEEATPESRLSQYDSKHMSYVDAAEMAGRPLTEQEARAKKLKKNVEGASIDHIIASGTGQNIMNEMTLRFRDGEKDVDLHGAKARAGDKPSQKKVRSGLAKQAAAAGRMQGYSRGIIEERQGEVTKRRRLKGGQPAEVVNPQQKRGQVLKDTLTAFQGSPAERYEKYKTVLKETFDSKGNLRLGDDKANIKVSTGMDVELDAEGKPTERSERLFDVHQAYGPERLLTEDRLFTRDDSGRVVSSSKQVKPEVIEEKEEEDKMDE